MSDCLILLHFYTALKIISFVNLITVSGGKHLPAKQRNQEEIEPNVQQEVKSCPRKILDTILTSPLRKIEFIF